MTASVQQCIIKASWPHFLSSCFLSLSNPFSFSSQVCLVPVYLSCFTASPKWLLLKLGLGGSPIINQTTPSSTTFLAHYTQRQVVVFFIHPLSLRIRSIIPPLIIFQHFFFLTALNKPYHISCERSSGSVNSFLGSVTCPAEAKHRQHSHHSLPHDCQG